METKLERVQYKKPIGIFLRDHYDPFIRNKFRQHKWLMDAEYSCIQNWAPERILKLEPLACCSQCDYTDKVKMEFNNEAQSQGMGDNNGAVGMEGLAYYLE